MMIKQFVNEVIPTNEMANAVTKADVRRIVAGTPIVWEDQEFTIEEITDYLWAHKAEYQEDAE
jgi:predicted oxidoreductase (fatty acid repression mutant protein)